MKKQLLYCTFVPLLFSGFLYGQEKKLDTVYIFDSQIEKTKLFHPVKNINPKEVLKNTTNLSELLRYQTNIYIKENGRGGSSSVSFRGTTASQTALVWNGIAINSQFLGQADLNNIPMMGNDEISIKAGGGSVVYGSGAIGGSIHLNNSMEFDKGLQIKSFSELGSFETFNQFLGTKYSSKKLSFSINGNWVKSKNRYEVPEKFLYVHRNGEYTNTSANIGLSYLIKNGQTISWHSQWYSGVQHFPVYTENSNKTKYEVQTNRNLLSWDVANKRINNSLKLAYTKDQFQYFGTENLPKTSGGDNENLILKNDFNFFIQPKLNFNTIVEFQNNKAEGYQSGIAKINRNTLGFSGLFRYYYSKNFRVEMGLKKEIIKGLDTPLLYSFSGFWQPKKYASTRINFSKNFRIPSFNDCYWQPGGNPELLPESSYNIELEQLLKYENIAFSVTPYFMSISNLLRWVSTPMGYWKAINTNQVHAFGFESELAFDKKTESEIIHLSLGYTMAKSINLETKKQLTYVPLHQFKGNIAYQYKGIKTYLQALYNGLTYTTTDENLDDAFTPYILMNLGVSSTFYKHYTLGVKVNNITNTVYETTNDFPMPKRNYAIHLLMEF